MNNKIIKTVLIVSLILAMTTVTAFAENTWAKNTYDWVKDGVWWFALAVIAWIAVKLLLKKMFAQFAGFAVLGAIVLVVIDDPVKLKTLGTTLWNIIFN
ncbi:MAG: hypothetical protein PWQ37_2352 [Candidatus Petromonas sp.]|jgi:hypothetical protein|nr:hypothetical protein [Candidatus Petromonas sp.]